MTRIRAPGPGLVGVSLFALSILFPLGPRFASGVGNIHLATVATLIWLAGWLIFVFAGPKGGLSLATEPQRAVLWLLLYILVQSFAHTTIFLDDPSRLFRSVQLFANIGIFLTVSSLSLDVRILKNLIRLSFVVLAAECCVAVLAIGPDIVGFLTGTFDGQHSHFAAYLLLLLCLLVAMRPVFRSRRARFLILLLIVASFLCLVFSYSRSAYIATACAMIALAHRKWGRRGVGVTALVIGLLVLLGAILAPASLRDRFSSITEAASTQPTDVSFATRTAMWRHILENLGETALVGKGLFQVLAIDNSFMRILVETGVVGLVLLVWVVFAIALWLYRAYSTEPDPEIRAFILGIYAATIGLLFVVNLAMNTLMVHRVMGLYWILFGSLIAVRMSRPRDAALAHTHPPPAPG